jgi:serine/threonine-protein kinase
MAEAFEAGQVIGGKYEILRTLGEGGMGVVLAARDVRLERTVAIKVLRPELASNKEAAERFVREARAAVKVLSEHVARVIDVDLDSSETPIMVMEYLEGQDLEQAIAERAPLAVADVALWVIQACDAIAEAHAQQIVHRDLKPANVFLARQPGGAEIVKVLDFGISKQVASGAANLSLTRTSALMGSPLYMSPEQMRSTRDVDTRTDIWALGAILHEALAGHPPFEGETITQLSANVLLEEPTRLDALRPDLPPRLADIVWRALRKTPAERFSHVGELALELMPFAPAHARAHVERIERVLVGAGLAPAAFIARGSAPPAPRRALADGDRFEPARPSIAARARTLANFVQTGESEPARKQAPLWRAFAALGVLAALAVLLLRSPPARLAASASAARPRAAASLTPPVPAAPTPEPAAVASVAPPVALAIEPEPTHDAPRGAGASPAAAKLVVTRHAATAPKNAASGAGVTSKASSASSIGTTRRVTTTESSTYSGTFKSKFGSRK